MIDLDVTLSKREEAIDRILQSYDDPTIVMEHISNAVPRRHFLIVKDRYISGHRASYYNLYVNFHKVPIDFENEDLAIIALGLAYNLMPLKHDSQHVVDTQRMEQWLPKITAYIASWIDHPEEGSKRRSSGYY
ncbi:hypothetical protein ACAF76_010570 [Brevibacillus sp. TJ4]|uniref:hypothetical protein n=1 Tax=Brevibacillus sp. TJ4 TaxID=3234853 RepID=UPI0037D4E098